MDDLQEEVKNIILKMIVSKYEEYLEGGDGFSMNPHTCELDIPKPAQNKDFESFMQWLKYHV